MISKISLYQVNAIALTYSKVSVLPHHGWIDTPIQYPALALPTQLADLQCQFPFSLALEEFEKFIHTS